MGHNKHQVWEQVSSIWSELFGDRKTGKFILENESFKAKQSLRHQEAISRGCPLEDSCESGTSSSPPSPTWLLPLSLPPSFCPRCARSWSKLLESSAGVVCPNGSTLTLIPRTTKAHTQVSIIVPNNCQECV